jgi:hypothetical protein
MGLSHFEELGFFGWVIPFARASVEETITDGDTSLQVRGIGYHDHNWLNFPFQSKHPRPKTEIFRNLKLSSANNGSLFWLWLGCLYLA